jgi:hypothetical protein
VDAEGTVITVSRAGLVVANLASGAAGGLGTWGLEIRDT